MIITNNCPICNKSMKAIYHDNEYDRAFYILSCDNVHNHYSCALYDDGRLTEFTYFEIQHPHIEHLNFVRLMSIRDDDYIASVLSYDSYIAGKHLPILTIHEYVPPTLIAVNRLLNLKIFL